MQTQVQRSQMMQPSRPSTRQCVGRRAPLQVSALFQSRSSVSVKERPAKQEVKNQEKPKQSFMSGVVDALDFAQPTKKDRELLDDAKANWKKGESKLSREEYAALARKIRGSYKDYFKDYVVEDRVESTYYKPDASTGTVPALPLLVGVVIAMLATTVFVVAQTS